MNELCYNILHQNISYSNIKISNFQQMQALEYNWKLIILLNVIWVYSDEQRPKTPILKIIKDENSIVALGLQKSFKRFS